MFTPLTKQQYENAIKTGFTPQQIIDMEKKRKAQNAEQPKGYFSRIIEDYTKAGQNIVSGIQEGAGVMERGLKQGGIGGALKTAGGALLGGLRTVGGVAEATFAPIIEAPGIKQGLEAIGTGISKIPGVDLIVQKAMELSKKYPSASKDLKNIIDIATLGVGKTIEKPIGKAIEKVGIGLEKSGLESANVAKNKFIQELVKPIETKAERIAQVGRTTETGTGIFKKSIIAPTQSEIKAAEEVIKIPQISEKNTFQQNFNVIKKYNTTQAEKLKADIKTYDFIVPKKELISRLDKAASSLQENPLIVGDAEKTANRLIAGAKKIIQENEGKGSGILQARKDYDNWVLSQKPKAFDATAENAFTIANREIRQTINNFLDEKAPNLGIKDSLRSQSNLYIAMENIAPKAAQEANTAIGRVMQKIGKILGTKSKIVQAVAATVGIGGLGAAATFAPPVAIIGGTGFVIYKTGKYIMKPAVRTVLGRLLKETSHLLAPEEKGVIQNALDTFDSE